MLANNATSEIWKNKITDWESTYLNLNIIIKKKENQVIIFS